MSIRVEKLKKEHLIGFKTFEGFSDGDVWLEYFSEETLELSPYLLAYIDNDTDKLFAIVSIQGLEDYGSIYCGMLGICIGKEFTKNTKEFLICTKEDDIFWNFCRDQGFNLLFSAVLKNNKKSVRFNKIFGVEPTEITFTGSDDQEYVLYEKRLSKKLDKDDYMMYRENTIQLLTRKS